MRTTFIYTLADPRTNEIRYVGKTNDPAYRAKTHRRKEHTKKGRWVGALLSLGLEPKLEILDEVPFSEWMFWEQHWIQVMRGWGFRLLNADNGGLGHYRITPELAKKISNTLAGRPNLALAKGVAQYSLDGVFLRTFVSFQEAAKAHGACHPNIIRAIRKGTSCAGFLWTYAKDVAPKIPTKFINGVLQISEETRAKLSAASKGRFVGRVFSPETRAKMSASAMRRWHGNNAPST